MNGPEAVSLDQTLLVGTSEKARSQWQLFWRRLLRHRLAILSALVLLVVILACFGAGIVAPYERNKMDLMTAGAAGPSSDHWFGTDELGRDQFTEILYAGQLSLKIGLAVAFVSTLMGAAIGALAGYFGRWIDQFLMRVTDLVLVIPGLLILAIGTSYVRENERFFWWDLGDRFLWFKVEMDVAIIAVIALIGWTYIARIMRGQVLSLKEKEFIEAARASGASDLRIVVRHILPNSVGVIMVNTTLQIAGAIVAESTLSFLGFGVQLPQNSWGRMLYDAKGYVGTDKAHMLYFPALMLLLVVLAVNFLGDGLRDAFDPQSKQESGS